MFSRTKLAASLAAAASVCLIAGSSFAAVSASAADPTDPDANGACTVTGGVTIASTAPGGGIDNGVAVPTTGVFVATTLTCNGDPNSDDVGDWKVNANFQSSAENCAGNVDPAVMAAYPGNDPQNWGPPNGVGWFTGGTGPSTGDDAIVFGGPAGTPDFHFTRVGTAVHVEGSLRTKNAAGTSTEHHPFVANLVFQPTNGVCSDPTSPADTTRALIITGSHAVVHNETSP